MLSDDASATDSTEADADEADAQDSLGPDTEVQAEIGPDTPDCDLDDDGHLSEACQGSDCDDQDDTVFTGAPDAVGDGKDQNCDGLDGVDADGDGYASKDSGGADCDDGNALVPECQDSVCFAAACCVPQCAGLICGNDGCGGNCGDCGDGGFCVEGKRCTYAGAVTT